MLHRKNKATAMKEKQVLEHFDKPFLAVYRVTRMVAEKIMLTSNSKFRHRPG